MRETQYKTQFKIWFRLKNMDFLECKNITRVRQIVVIFVVEAQEMGVNMQSREGAVEMSISMK